jgi:glycosyltransferase involved in cell wall biosynthesis
MKNKYKFSVITAIKNGLNEIQRTYQSLISQTSQDFEWIVIDSNSSDGTPEWLANVVIFEERLNWVSEEDLGISDAWNKGLALSRGEHILILNAGDEYEKEFISIITKLVNNNIITCCNARILDVDGIEVGVFKAQPNKLWRGMHLPHNWCCVPRKIYEQFGYYKIMQHSMDFEWFHRYYKIRGKDGFKVLNEVLGNYRLGGHSDIHYSRSFFTNAEIMINTGTNRFLASIICILYVSKHYLVNRILR